MRGAEAPAATGQMCISSLNDMRRREVKTADWKTRRGSERLRPEDTARSELQCVLLLQSAPEAQPRETVDRAGAGTRRGWRIKRHECDRAVVLIFIIKKKDEARFTMKRVQLAPNTKRPFHSVVAADTFSVCQRNCATPTLLFVALLCSYTTRDDTH